MEVNLLRRLKCMPWVINRIAILIWVTVQTASLLFLFEWRLIRDVITYCI